MKKGRSLGQAITPLCHRGRKFIDLTGRIFGHLEVLSRAESRKHPKGVTSTYWICLCHSCNEKVEVASHHLRRNLIRSCGKRLCRDLALLGPFNWLTTVYRGQAKQRGLRFSLSVADVERISQSICHYCGEAPFRPIAKNWAAQTYPHFRWNGIDRLDSTKDYTLDNVVPCCFPCNRAKLTMTSAEFLEWVVRVYNHNRKSGRI